MPILLSQKNVGLIIIDSIAGIFRTTDTDIRERAMNMRLLIKTLNILSNTYGCAIVCTNQITSCFHNDEYINIPALGMAWANLVTTRVIVSKVQHNDASLHSNKSYNKFEIKFSPYLNKQSCYYKISGDGIVDV